jgi:hypothetical protein
MTKTLWFLDCLIAPPDTKPENYHWVIPILSDGPEMEARKIVWEVLIVLPHRRCLNLSKFEPCKVWQKLLKNTINIYNSKSIILHTSLDIFSYYIHEII